MSHPIIEGPVNLLKIVTPGAYWIRCAACEGSSRVPTSIKRKPHGLGNEYYYPHQGDKVFVQDEDGFFYRGTVCGRREVPESECWHFFGSSKYVVQLTDTFQVKDFYQHGVYPSYGESSTSCQSAHLVFLYHMLPQMPPAAYGKCVKIGTDEHKTFENEVIKWDLSVESMAHLTDNMKFSFVQSKIISDCVYGELSTYAPLRTQTGAECYSLSDYLHLEKLAVQITFRFTDVVCALMTNPLVDYSELLGTFDPFGKTTFKQKPKLPVEKPPIEKPLDHDFSGFRVHPDDVALHQSLSKGNFYFINIFFTDAPLEDDTVVRYVSQDGTVVLGTVMSVDLKHSEVESDRFSVNGFGFPNSARFYKTTQDEEMIYPDEWFKNQPPDYLDSFNEPGNSLLSYNFDECRQNFKAAGGIFEEKMFLPYPCSLAAEDLFLRHLESLGVDSLRDWQKLCLPTFSSRKNLLVLGPNSMGKSTTSVLCALSWMSLNYNSNSDSKSVHPQLIMFFSDLDRADKKASLCTQLTDFRVMVSTSFVISQKQKEIAANGCDVLITTPSNWAKLVSQGVFDYSGLYHVIFDELDRLREHYADDLVNIFQALESSCIRRVQAIAVSSTWVDLIGTSKVVATLCVADVLLSCIYCKLTPTVVFIDRDDSTKQLEKIIRQRAQKRLLLCKDELEGRSVMKQVSCIEDVFFVHETLQKETALKIMKEWDSSCDKLLVCTDNFFEEHGFVKDVDVMMSWMTTSWTTLSNRFKVFRNATGFKADLSSATAYMFCDCNNLDELLLVKNIVPNVHFVNGSLEEHMSRASFNAERVKRTTICPSIFMFGKCNGVPTCPLRHLFRLEDDPESSHLTQSLKVNILKVHSAFRYSVRVMEIISNHEQKGTKNMYTLISKLKEIEEGLAKSRRDPCSPILKIGDMVGARIVCKEQSLLRRVVVKSVPEDASSDLYSLSIIDFEEPDVKLSLSQLFVLSKEVANHPKDGVDLYISGLMPADFKSDWKNDTCHFVTGAVKNLIEETNFIAGKVQMVSADRYVLVDTLHCFKEDGPIKRMVVNIGNSLKHCILESDYCVEHPAHLPLLSELLIKSAATSYNSMPPGFVRYSRHYLFGKHEGKFGFRTDLPSIHVPAVVSSFEDPGLIYVQLTEESEKLKNFNNALSLCLNRSKQKLRLIAVDELCAVQYQGTWNRAIIFDIIGDLENFDVSVDVLFVDYGDTMVDIQPNQLYCLPDEFVEMPFFAIQCELVGIKPFRGGKWDKETVEKFRSYVRTRGDTMTHLIIQFCEPRNMDQISKFFSKQMGVFWELHDPEPINSRLARGGLALYDLDTKHLLIRSFF